MSNMGGLGLIKNEPKFYELFDYTFPSLKQSKLWADFYTGLPIHKSSIL